MIDRKTDLKNLSQLIKRHPVTGIIGARQVGKTTLARRLVEIIDKPYTIFDLENPEHLVRLADPMLALKNINGLVVIDEVQRSPELFPVLRVLVDRPNNSTRFLVLGSASPDLIRQSSESLAGRIIYYELNGFSIKDVGFEKNKRLWVRGSFPKSYLARSENESNEWRKGFIRTFLERDIPQLGINIKSPTLRRFWMMLAHYHGQTWNASEFGRSFGVADTTVRNYLDVLTHALVIRQLQPWYENISKRQIKAPKIYINDCGLMHTLLNIKNYTELENHPKIGASWEGFVIENIIRHLDVDFEDCYYWATHSGAELDLLIVLGQNKYGFEIKRTTAPKITRSMHNAIKDLQLKILYIIHAGDDTFPLSEKIQAVPFINISKDIRLHT